MQKIRMTADGHEVFLTDSPEEARLLQKNSPVIGIYSPGAGKSWSGISFLAEDWDDVDDAYVELAYCRYYHLPRTLLLTDDKLNGEADDKTAAGRHADNRTNSACVYWKIREAAVKDAAGFAALYEDESVRKFLEYPLSRHAKSLSDWEEWIESQHRCVYPSEEPAMWVLADENDEFMGRIGLEYRESSHGNASAKCDAIFDKDTESNRNLVSSIELDIPDGYYLGYALLPKWRKKGLAAQAASLLLKFCFEYWQLDIVYLLCSCENIASIKTALACGFSHIRTISDAAFLNNASLDVSANACYDASLSTSGTFKDIVKHPLNLGSGVGAGELFLFARKAF